jgi:hypothetical protein
MVQEFQIGGTRREFLAARQAVLIRLSNS